MQARAMKRRARVRKCPHSQSKNPPLFCKSHLETRLDGTGEDTTESEETTLVGSGHHLGNVEHERPVGVAVADSLGVLVVEGTLVESVDTVLLGDSGRRQVKDNHLKERVTGRQELLHDGLEEELALHVLFVRLHRDLELLEHGEELVLLAVHDGVEDLVDGVQHEHVEGTVELGAVLVHLLLDPLLGLGVEEVVAPETLHHLVLVNAELLGVTLGKLTEGEGPSVETGTESDGTVVGVDLDVTESSVVVGGDDDVDRLDDTRQVLEKREQTENVLVLIHACRMHLHYDPRNQPGRAPPWATATREEYGRPC